MLRNRLKELRRNRGLSQTGLAHKAGVSQQLIGKIETGKVTETRKLPQIARALGLSVEAFLAGDLNFNTESSETAPEERGDWPFPFSRVEWASVPQARQETIIDGMVAAIARARGRANGGRPAPSRKSG